VLLTNLAHRRVADPSVDRTVAPKTRFPPAACTSSGVRRDGSTAPLSYGEMSLGSDRAGPACRQPGVRRRAGRRRPDPVASIYRLIVRPALAEIVGDGRPWTVLMISLLSMPWR
jgi:hypothetical protein